MKAETTHKEFRVRVNYAAPVVYKTSVLIHAKPEAVWKVLSDIQNWEKWNTEVSNVQINGAPKEGAKFIWKSGANITSWIHTVNPCSQIGWTGKALSVYAIHNWTMQEVNGSTELTSEESMEGWMAKLFKKTFQNTLEKGTAKWFNLLKVACEK
jgi:hypothetical protein